MKGMSGDIWARLNIALDEGPWGFTFGWVNSHPEDAMMIQSAVPAIVYKGNKKADEITREAADSVQVPHTEVTHTKRPCRSPRKS